MTQSFHRRNPIFRHGQLESQFVQIPNELARDSTLSHHAYRIAVVMRTHAQGFEVSAKSLAEDYGWGRPRVARALAELVDAGWLAIRRYVNAEGHRIYDEYHLDVARRFRPDEVEAFGAEVMLPTSARDESNRNIQVERAGSSGCAATTQLGGTRECTKEHQSKNHLEDQPLEEQEEDDRFPERLDCVVCEQFGRRECRQHSESCSVTDWPTLLSSVMPSR